MKHIWSILCQKSVIDSETNNLSIIDILEQINISSHKNRDQDNLVLPIRFELISFFSTEKSSQSIYQLKVKLWDPNKKLLREIDSEFSTQPENSRFRHKLQIQGFPISRDGYYSFEIFLKEKSSNKKYTHIAQIPLEVQYEENATRTKKR